jgi:hypothetical protein
MGTTQRTKSNGFLALPVAQKSASSTGGGPSGEFGARNSPRAGTNHPRGVRTEYDRRLARRRPPGGAAPPTRVRGGGCWVWCTGARDQIYRRRNTTLDRVFGPPRGRTEVQREGNDVTQAAFQSPCAQDVDDATAGGPPTHPTLSGDGGGTGVGGAVSQQTRS